MNSTIQRSETNPMRYFTLELLRDAGSDDEMIADHAHSIWEKRIKDYTQHLNALEKSSPDSVKKLISTCFHDYIVTAIDETQPALSIPLPLTSHPRGVSFRENSDIPPPVFVLRLRASDSKRNADMIIVYFLWDDVRQYLPEEIDRTTQFVWLYDEIDLPWARRAREFVHRVLFKQGIVWEIPFHDCLLLPADLNW